MEKRNRYRSFLAWLLWAGILCGLIGCTPWKQVPDYRATDFCAEIVWESCGVLVCATLQTESSGRENGNGGRDFSMTITAPAAMKGMTLFRRNGELTVGWENILTDGGALEKAAELGGMLLAEGELTILYPDESAGESILYGEIQGENGRIYEVYVERKSGAPRRIKDGSQTVEVRRFSPLP